MVSAEDAANRVAAFLDKHAELNGTRSDFLLSYDHTHYALRTSDLRALINAVPETHDGELLWFRRDDRMWHAVCGLEVLLIDTALVCECGATGA